MAWTDLKDSHNPPNTLGRSGNDPRPGLAEPGLILSLGLDVTDQPNQVRADIILHGVREVNPMMSSNVRSCGRSGIPQDRSRSLTSYNVKVITHYEVIITAKFITSTETNN